MRKNNTAIIFGSLFFSCSVMAANGTLAPTVVPMVNGGQASIAISNTSPNLFTVPGDRIIAVNSLDGALTNNEQTASGGVVVATVNKKPFTFILETERGLNLSIQAVPREGAGRTIQLVSDLRGTGEEAGAWETSTPYESLLVTISQAGRSCDDGADRWSGVVCRKIITPFLARGFFPGILRLSSGCAGRSGAVTGVVSLTARG
ncbi:type-F conjugative transfer system secretin TraK [Escherichia coli]|nr:type-F conjugative transfer system secretin TraK [Escherichia coli]